ncbi:hypothetical protein LguiB_023169 [Lonicera macranthoides]
MSVSELGCTYACLILSNDSIPITAEKIASIVKAANLAKKRNIEDLIVNVGASFSGAVALAALTSGFSGAAAAPPPEEKEESEESDVAMGFSLFDLLFAREFVLCSIK